MLSLLVCLSFRFQTDDSWLGADKVKHFATSYVLYVAGETQYDRRTGFTISIGAGLGKEIYDGFFRRGFSYKDLLWDIAGVAAAYLLIGK